jgi:meso-butanediol dehydrogenase / (S,S)-butanediol dehydrogenase / diacetyl reductase
MAQQERFGGKVALVVGGTSGIGLASARRLDQEGAAVTIAGRRETEGAAAAAAMGGEAAFHRVDVRHLDQVEELLAAVASRHGRLDVVVNCAGVLVVAPTMSVRPEHWRRTMAINLDGTFHVCVAAVPHLRATIAAGLASQTAIVTVVSIDAIAADRGFAAYNAAKAGALNFSRSLALELAGEGIRVNTVSPGAVDTAMTSLVTGDERAGAAFATAIPVGRIGRPDEIAAAVAFAASDEASFLVGSNIVVDGGVTAATGHPDMLALFAPPSGS